MSEQKRPLISNVHVLRNMEIMKQRLQITSDAELVTTALSLLHQSIQLQDEGYKIAAIKENGLFGGREIRDLTIRTTTSKQG
jgi:hypothetical protein